MAKMRIKNQELPSGDIYSTIFEHFPDILHSVNAEGNILFTNKAAETLLGYTRDELLGMNVSELYADDVLRDMEEGFQSLKQEGDMSIESALKDKAGVRIPVEIRSFSIYTDEGDFLRTFSIIRDIRRIKELQDGLIQSEKLAGIGELAAGIAHDINNPCHVIKMAVGALEAEANKEIKDPEAFRQAVLEYVGFINKASEWTVKLVRHLLDFSRGVVENPEVVDLHQVIEDALFLVGSKMRRSRVVVHNEVESKQYFIEGVPSRLEQVFANFFSNACDAMEHTEERDLTIKIQSSGDDEKLWRCDLIDTGTGIKPENQSEVFRSFFTTKPKGKGSGLGLSIARGIIENHGGRVELCSEYGKGVTFSVYLPKHSPE